MSLHEKPGTVLFESLGPTGTTRVVIPTPPRPGQSPNKVAIQFRSQAGNTKEILIFTSEIEAVIDALTEAAELMKYQPGRRYLPEPSGRPVAWEGTPLTTKGNHVGRD